MNLLVLDASVALAWCFEDEGDDALRVLSLATRTRYAVPAVWPFEIANALAVAERRKRLKAADAARFLELLWGLAIEVEAAPWGAGLASLAALCRAHGLSAYDAAYLDLAQRLGAPLATLDAGLARAAHAAGTRLVVPIP